MIFATGRLRPSFVPGPPKSSRGFAPRTRNSESGNTIMFLQRCVSDKASEKITPTCFVAVIEGGFLKMKAFGGGFEKNNGSHWSGAM